MYFLGRAQATLKISLFPVDHRGEIVSISVKWVISFQDFFFTYQLHTKKKHTIEKNNIPAAQLALFFKLPTGHKTN